MKKQESKPRALEIDESDADRLVINIPGFQLGKLSILWIGPIFYFTITAIFIVINSILFAGTGVQYKDYLTIIGLIIFITTFTLDVIMYKILIHLYYINKEIIIDKRRHRFIVKEYYTTHLKLPIINRSIESITEIDEAIYNLYTKYRTYFLPYLAVFFKHGLKFRICFLNQGNPNNPISASDYQMLQDLLTKELIQLK